MNPYLLPVLEFGPQIIGRLIEEMPEDVLDVPTGAGRFTPREVVAHLADWEPIMLSRIHQAIENQGSVLTIYDEGQMATAHRYAESDVRQQLELLQNHRKETAEYLRRLPENLYDNVVEHPERGKLTVKDQAWTLIGHDMYHIEQLTSVLVVAT